MKKEIEKDKDVAIYRKGSTEEPDCKIEPAKCEV